MARYRRFDDARAATMTVPEAIAGVRSMCEELHVLGSYRAAADGSSRERKAQPDAPSAASR